MVPQGLVLLTSVAKIGKRQAEELVLRAALDVDGFCEDRRPAPAPDEHALVLTFDGKGIVMRPDALRLATAKAAAAARNKLATRLSPGEKNGRKRMAELACVYDAVPVPRTPEDFISTPAKKRKENKAQDRKPTAAAPDRPSSFAHASMWGHRLSVWSPILAATVSARTIAVVAWLRVTPGPAAMSRTSRPRLLARCAGSCRWSLPVR
jgi:hypothetical protein